jgi:hypothetical protein
LVFYYPSLSGLHLFQQQIDARESLLEIRQQRVGRVSIAKYGLFGRNGSGHKSELGRRFSEPRTGEM